MGGSKASLRRSVIISERGGRLEVAGAAKIGSQRRISCTTLVRAFQVAGCWGISQVPSR